MFVPAKTTRAVLLALLGIVGLTACQFGISWKDDDDEIVFEGEILNGDTLRRPDSETCQPVKICFLDEDGKPIGGDVLEPGQTIPIPPGAKDAKAKPLEDPRDRASGPGHLARLHPWKLRRFAIDPDPTRGVSEYSMTVWARTLDEAEATADAVELALRTGDEPPAGVYEIDYATYSLLQGTTMAFHFADNRSFSRLDVTLNGVLVSTLDEMSVRSRPGLHVAAFELPLTSFQIGGLPGVTYTNTYAFEIENEGDPSSRVGRQATVHITP